MVSHPPTRGYLRRGSFEQRRKTARGLLRSPFEGSGPSQGINPKRDWESAACLTQKGTKPATLKGRTTTLKVNVLQLVLYGSLLTCCQMERQRKLSNGFERRYETPLNIVLKLASEPQEKAVHIPVRVRLSFPRPCCQSPEEVPDPHVSIQELSGPIEYFSKAANQVGGFLLVSLYTHPKGVALF